MIISLPLTEKKKNKLFVCHHACAREITSQLRPGDAQLQINNTYQIIYSHPLYPN